MTAARLRSAASAVALAAVSLVCACVSPTVRRHPDLDALLRPVKKVGIMPVRADVSRSSFLGERESLAPDADSARAAVVAALQSELASRGFAVAIVPSGEAYFREHPDRRFLETDVETAADAATVRAFRATSSKDRAAFSGMPAALSELQPVAATVDADALLFARFSEAITTRGFLPTLHDTELEVSLVDAVTGEVLYAGRGAENQSTFSVDPAEFTSVALKGLGRVE